MLALPSHAVGPVPRDFAFGGALALSVLLAVPTIGQVGQVSGDGRSDRLEGV